MDILNEINSDPKSLSPLVLAYIGDAVFELMVRGYVKQEIKKYCKCRFTV